ASKGRMLRSVGNAAALTLLLTLPAHAAAAATESSTDRLAALAHARFGTLSAAETALVRGAPSRSLTWVGPNADPDSPANGAAQGATWGPERPIRPDLLRWMVTDPAASALVDPSGIGFAGARLGGPLDLSFAKVAAPITIVRSYVPDGVDLRSARLQDF